MKQKKSSFDWYATRQRFSIRKYHIGAASVLLGTALVLGNAATVSADENTPAIVATAEAAEVADASQAPAVDKTALTQAVEAAKAIDLANKPAELAESFVEVFTQATDVLAKADASQEDVDAVLTKLNAAVEAIQTAVTVDLAPAVLGTPVATPDADELAPVAETTEETATEAPAAEEAAEVNHADANAFPIEFIDTATGRVLDPNTAFNGGDGQNMKFSMRVTFGENVTNKTVDIKLPRFISIIDPGNTNIAVQDFISGYHRTTQASNLLSEDGDKYRQFTGTADYDPELDQTLTYTVKDSTTSLTIPIIISSYRWGGLKGFATDGEIAGNNVGIEQVTPITVVAKGTKAGQATTSTSLFNEINVPNGPDLGINIWYPGASLNEHGQTTATTDNNYEVIVPLHIYNYSQSGLTENAYGSLIESMTFDYVLPKGVTYLGGLDTEAGPNSNNSLWQKTAEITEGDNTRITFESKQSFLRFGDAKFFVPKFKVDPDVIDRDKTSMLILVENVVVTGRNKTESKRATYTIDVPIVHLTDQDDIAFYTEQPGVYSHTYTNPGIKPANPNLYVSLGSLEWGSVRTFDDHVSRPKELRYEFPANDHFEVKGVRTPIYDNGHIITTVKVATKANPTLKEVILSEPITFSGVATTIDVGTLGLSPDDVLTELIIPVGAFEPGKNYNISGGNAQDHIYGKYLSDTPSAQTSTLLTLRDENYDVTSSDRNWVTGTGTLKIYLDSTTGHNDVFVRVPETKTINYGNTEVTYYYIESTRQSNEAYWNRKTDEISKVHIVVPTDVEVAGVKFRNEVGEYFTSEVVASQRIDGANTIYTYDFKDVTGLNKYLGRLDTAESDLIAHRIIVAEVSYKNNVETDTRMTYDQRFFVEIPEDSSRPKTGSASKRGVDPYNLVANDQLLFTNLFDTSNVLTLPKADKLDLTTTAKLSTDGTYKSANDVFRILDIGQDLDLKLNVGNKLDNEVGELDLFLPIPKVGQNWGTNFQTNGFDFGLILKGLDVDAKVLETFDITYATVDASKLTGQPLNAQSLSTESFGSIQTTNTNLVRIKTKPGVKIPANTDLPVVLKLGLQNATSASDGKVITWNPYYSATYNSGSSADKARDINLSVTLGKLGLSFFEDANASGTKDGSEAKFAGTPTYEVFDDTGKAVDITGLTEASRDGVVVKGLTSTKTYAVRVTAPTGYRFTTGTKNADATRTGTAIVATLTDTASTQLTAVGLTRVITLVDPALTTVNDTKNVSAAEKEQVKTAVTAKNPSLPANTRLDVAADGTVTVTYPDGFTQTIPGTKTVQQRATSAAPTINAIDNDDTTISGTGVTGATVTVNIPGQGSRTVPVTNGTWTVTGVTPLATGTNVTVTQTEPSKLVSPVTTKAVVAAPSAKPVINKVDTDDTTITGTGVPGATISVTIPGVATPVTTKVGPNGEWSVPLTKPLTAGQTVTATQTEPNKAATPSDPKTVVATTADGLTPTAKTPHTVPLNSDPVAKDAINTTGLPADTRYEWVTKPDTTTTGPKTGSVRVTFSDGSSKVVPINLTVVDQRKLAEIHEPIGQDVTINAEEAVTPISRIINTNEMPPNTTYEWENGAPDVRIAGTSRIAYVKVKYSDGSHDSVQVRINIRPNMAQRNIPEGYVPTGLRLNQNLTPDAFIKNLASLPANTQFTWAAQPNMATRGAKVGRIRVTYTDGSTEEVIIRFNLR